MVNWRVFSGAGERGKQEGRREKSCARTRRPWEISSSLRPPELWSMWHDGPSLRTGGWPFLPRASSATGCRLPWGRGRGVGCVNSSARQLLLAFQDQGTTQSPWGALTQWRESAWGTMSTRSRLRKVTQIISAKYALDPNLLIPNLLLFSIELNRNQWLHLKKKERKQKEKKETEKRKKDRLLSAEVGLISIC